MQGLSRREVLQRGAIASLAAALAQLPELLDVKGLLKPAFAQSSDLTTDTLNGLLAFVAPGNDEYSKQQGQSTNRPGGAEIPPGATRRRCCRCQHAPRGGRATRRPTPCNRHAHGCSP